MGVYPEIKYSSYFASIGLPIEEPLLEILRRHGWDDACDPVLIQSFETGNLKRLNSLTRLRLIQLIGSGNGLPYDLTKSGDPRTCGDLLAPDGLRQIAGYADGIGVTSARVVPIGPDGRSQPATSLIEDAHRQGLLVHVSTIREENGKLPADYRLGNPAARSYSRAAGNVKGWLERLFRLHVDGVLADNPGSARAIRDRLYPGR